VEQRHTRYDGLLMDDWDRGTARAETEVELEAVLGRWRATSG
jgi:hypothetical protein